MKTKLLTSSFAFAALVACDQQANESQEQAVAELSAEDFEGMTPEEIEVLQMEIEGAEAPVTDMDLAAATEPMAATCWSDGWSTGWPLSVGGWFCRSSLDLWQRANAKCRDYMGNRAYIPSSYYHRPCNGGFVKLYFTCCR